MSSKLPTPVKQATTRARTPSAAISMKPPSSSATTSTPNRRLSTSIPRTSAMPPKTAPRLGQRSSMQVSAADQKKLAEEIDAAQETDKKFVSYMTDTLLTRLTGCANLSEARYLRISESDAKIKFIENMDKVENLEELDLSDNEITQIRGLNPLKRLKVLNLSTNMITLIEGFDYLLRLEELDLSGNRVERIPVSIKCLASLKILKLHNNKLNTLRDLAHLRPLKNLVSLTIFSNPMSEAEHARLFTIFTLPTLSTLDDSFVDDEERESAKSRFSRTELEHLEHQLAQARAEIKSAKETIEKLEKTHSGVKSNETRLGNDVNSLMKRISQLETESAAKTELLNKKSAELVGLCELLYEMKQELAFANIDRQFDMSAVDSIIGDSAAGNIESATGAFSPVFDAELEALEYEAQDGFVSPITTSGTMSPLPFVHSGVAQEFREMPYIGKTSSTPARNRSGSSRSGSRAPNGGSSATGYSRKQLFATAAQSQQAAHRYKTLKLQENQLQEEAKKLDAVLEAELAKLQELETRLKAKQQFVDDNPEDPNAFAMHIEIETIRQDIALQETVVDQLRSKRAELDTRLEPLQIEAEQMKSLLGDMDDETIDSAYDLSMELKRMESQLEDRDETIRKMQKVLEAHNLLSELDRTVVLRDLLVEGSASNTKTSSHTHTVVYEDVMARLREMEQNHLDRVTRLIAGFPRYPTEQDYWSAQPTSVDTACHTLEQQITDAFGFSFGGTALTASVASLHERIKQLEKHIEYLEHLKYTNFFNIEDGLDEADLLQPSENSNSPQENDAQEILFALPKRVEAPPAKTEGETEVDSDEDEDAALATPAPRGTGYSYGVRREKLGNSLLKQLWFLWRLLAMKMDTVRKAWESGVIASSDMQAIVESGEWKYWTGMGRLEFFFQHAMSHISILETQISDLQTRLATATKVEYNPTPALEMRDSLLAEIKQVSEDLELKRADVVAARAELEVLQSLKMEHTEAANNLEKTQSDLKALTQQKEAYESEIAHLKAQIDECKIKRDDVDTLRAEYNKWSRQVADAHHAREELALAKQEYARITVEIAGTQRLRNELEALKTEVAAAKERAGVAHPTTHMRRASNDVSQLSSRTSQKQISQPPHYTAAQVSMTATNSTVNSSIDSSTPSAYAHSSATVTTSSGRTPISRSQTVSYPPSPSVAAHNSSSETRAYPIAEPKPSPAVKEQTKSTSASASRQSLTSSSPTPADTTSEASTVSLTASSSSTEQDGSVSERLSQLRHKEKEARMLKEKSQLEQSKRAPPKRSWTVAETVGLARPTGPDTNKPSPATSASSSHLPATQSTSSSPSVSESPSEEHVIQGFVSDDVKKQRRKSLLPSALQEFLKETGAPH